MSVVSRLKGMKKRWWVLLGTVALGFVAGLWLLVRWVQYRAYQNVDLLAILPDEAQAAIRVPGLAARWPAMAKAPALVAVARARNPGRVDGPLSMAEMAELFGGSMPEDEARVMEAAGRDFAAAFMYGSGSQDFIAATRVPFSYFLFQSFIRRAAPPEVALEFRGDILIAGSRPDWVATAAARVESGDRGRVALEIEAASSDGEPAFWIDLAALRKDPKYGPRFKETFNSVPVREALFMLDLEAARSITGKLVLEGAQARLQGTVLLSQKLDARLAHMYAMPDGDPGFAAMLPPNTCYATGAKAEAGTSWDFLKNLTKPEKGTNRRKTVSEAFGDFVSNVYLYLHDGIESSEEHGSAKEFRAMFDRDVAFALTAEKDEPFVGLTLFARVKDGKVALEKLYQYFLWLNEDPEKKGDPNAKLFKLRSENYRDLDVRVLEGQHDILGKGAEPAFTVVNDVLVLTSSFSTLKQIADVTLAGVPGFAAGSSGMELSAAAPSDGPAWAYANVRALRTSLVAMKDLAAKTQVEREVEATGAAKLRQKVAEKFRKSWEASNSGQAWVEAAHVLDIDAAYNAHIESERARVAADMGKFAGRLDPIAGLAFVVRQGKGDSLEWRAVLAAEK
ncbi:MAG: hypothetical protein FD180_4066 [Planctomycetota bacterium]|nr:MAG: hypothetical protein FD180_4066 [Planctomycetota bacterium]